MKDSIDSMFNLLQDDISDIGRFTIEISKFTEIVYNTSMKKIPMYDYNALENQ